MRPIVSAVASLFLLWVQPGFGRSNPAVCGTSRETGQEQLHLHRRSERGRALRLKAAGARASIPPFSATRAVGNVVVMDDADGVVSRRNDFNLTRRTLRWTANTGATAYRFLLTDPAYDTAAASEGTRLDLGDDDTRRVALPFDFRYFGQTYREIWVNSDGNLTFGAGDGSTADRSLGRLVAGAPRIAGLFTDLDPSRSTNGVRVLSEPARFVVSWSVVPEYTDFGTGRNQTFQIRLYPDSRIEVSWDQIALEEAVVGISPGEMRGQTSVVTFLDGSFEEFAGAVAERFSGSFELDIVTAAQKFYQSNEDAYDFLVFYNALDIGAGDSALAYEVTVRNNRTGYGDPLIDVGREYGSQNRLQAVINMGSLRLYPRDPNGIVTARRPSQDTPLTVLGHEAGHLFMAYASVRDPRSPTARPMLGYQQAHWRFNFNAEASLVDGGRIVDGGAGQTPRFRVTDIVREYSPLDQYIMGLRAPEEVPPTFLVENPTLGTRVIPESGITFDGSRRDIAIDEIVAAEGRRTPDHTVAQRRYRFAFILITARGVEPSAGDIATVDVYRREFETFFSRAASERATADTALRRRVTLSLFPAAGVIEGRTGSATISIQSPAQTPQTFALRVAGAVSVPGTVTIPAGATSQTFSVRGERVGVDSLTVDPPAGSEFETAFARIQVARAADARLTVVSGDRQIPAANGTLPEPIRVRVTDVNALPYAGVPVTAAAGASGSVEPAAAVTGPDGIAVFRWSPGLGGNPELRLNIEGRESGAIAVTARVGGPAVSAVVNAASYANAIAPGTLATLYGSNLLESQPTVAPFPWPQALAGTRVLISGRATAVLYAAAGMINFLVPADTPLGTADIQVATAVGTSVAARVPIAAAAPGVFFDAASGFGAILNANTALTTQQQAAPRGGFIEIYCTGIGTGTPRVRIAGVQAEVTYSGLVPGYQGFFQVNARIPENVAPGTQPLVIESGEARGNEVRVGIR